MHSSRLRLLEPRNYHDWRRASFHKTAAKSPAQRRHAAETQRKPKTTGLRTDLKGLDYKADIHCRRRTLEEVNADQVRTSISEGTNIFERDIP